MYDYYPSIIIHIILCGGDFVFFQNGSLVQEDPLVLYEWAGLRKKNIHRRKTIIY